MLADLIQRPSDVMERPRNAPDVSCFVGCSVVKFDIKQRRSARKKLVWGPMSTRVIDIQSRSCQTEKCVEDRSDGVCCWSLQGRLGNSNDVEEFLAVFSPSSKISARIPKSAWTSAVTGDAASLLRNLIALLRVLSTARCSFPDRRNTSSSSPIGVRRDAVPSLRRALVVSRARLLNSSDGRISHEPGT